MATCPDRGFKPPLKLCGCSNQAESQKSRNAMQGKPWAMLVVQQGS